MNDSCEVLQQEPGKVDSKPWGGVAERYPFGAFVGTVSGYLYVYFYKAAYLRYFGIPDSFIDITISDLAKAGALGISLVILAIYFFQIFPVALMRPIANIISTFRYSIIVVSAMAGHFFGFGFSRWLIIYFLCWVVSVGFEISSLRLGLRKWRSLSAYSQHIDELDKDVRGRFLSGAMFSSRHGSYWGPMFFLSAFLLIAGNFFGENSAKSVSNILVFERDSERFAVVLHSGGQLLSVPVSEISADTFRFEKSLSIINLEQQVEFQAKLRRARLLAEDAKKAKSYADFLAEECALNSVICRVLKPISAL